MNKNPFHDPSLAKRHQSARWFKHITRLAVLLTLAFLVIFLLDIVSTALPALKQTYIQVEVNYSSKAQRFTRLAVARKYRKLVSRAWLRSIPMQIRNKPELRGKKVLQWVMADDQVDQFIKKHHNNLKPKQIKVIEQLVQQKRIRLQWNWNFLGNGDSKIPEYAGIYSALIGSIMTLAVTMIIAFPIGVMTAIYLEEFAGDNRFTRFIEVNINNLASIPSILFGLLGLSIFINLFGLARSSPLVGGMTLALMTLPIIIVSSRSALRSVPDAIRQAGYGLGLNKIQVIQDHVLPIAMPGILTGSIIGMAQAMGETAPLIIIGMIAFIPDAPHSITQAATVLPAQIYTWAGMPERIYIEKTAAGIIVILLILIALNASAIYLRKKYEIKW